MLYGAFGLAFAAVLAYAGWRFVRGDWSAASIEERPEDSAWDDDDDDGWDDDDPDRP